MPTARTGLSLAAGSNGKLYAMGGDGSGDHVEEYDPATNVWTTRASMSIGRTALASATTGNGKLVVVGGQGFRRSYFATVEEYDPVLDVWTSRADMLTARAGLGIARASNGKLYAIGGFNRSGHLATVEEFGPAR